MTNPAANARCGCYSAAQFRARANAETAMIGALLANPELFTRLAAVVDPEELSPQARVTWDTVRELREADRDASLLPVSQRLARDGKIEAAGGISLLCYATDLPSQIENAEPLALEWLLDLRDAADASTLLGRDIETTRERIEMLDAKIADLRGEADECAVPALADQIAAENADDAPRTAEPLWWGIADLDGLCGGIKPGTLNIVGARPGHGKSALARLVALQAAERGTPALFVSIEMSPRQCHELLLCGIAGIDTRAEERTRGERQALAEKAQKHRGLPIRYRDTTQLDAILAVAYQAARLDGLGLLVVDYLQLVAVAAKRRNQARYEIVGEVSQRLKRFALETGVPVVAPAQIARDIQGVPKLHHLRESGNIEQDADLVVLVHFRNEESERAQRRGAASLIVAKNRNGRTGSTTGDFEWRCAAWRSAKPVYADPLEV